MIQTAYFSCVESNAYIMLIETWRLSIVPNLLTWSKPAKDTAKMASVKAVEECLCVSCLVLTKYRCTSCETPICSKCSHFEHNEETEGWMVGKAVSYCGFCYEEREADEPNTNMMAMNITDKESSSPRSPSPPPKRYIDIYILIPNDSATPACLYQVLIFPWNIQPGKKEAFPG